MTAIRFAFGIF